MTVETTDVRRELFVEESTTGSIRTAWDLRRWVTTTFGVTTSDDAGSAWYWSAKWQRMEREADADVAAGRVTRYENVDDFLASLGGLEGE